MGFVTLLETLFGFVSQIETKFNKQIVNRVPPETALQEKRPQVPTSQRKVPKSQHQGEKTPSSNITEKRHQVSISQEEGVLIWSQRGLNLITSPAMGCPEAREESEDRHFSKTDLHLGTGDMVQPSKISSASNAESNGT
ncbi:hypothetical protein RRG08_030900 [Elysia crispata]|uniref:Uncharacterized protein n=1 Tax=Elysia crispata TaxID=231223 RepID=A0AAE1DZ29_9GAST|nr:hypothetical protein RRG08_030900 [Elysia crispata]